MHVTGFSPRACAFVLTPCVLRVDTFLTCSLCSFLLAVLEARMAQPPSGSLKDQLRDDAAILGISHIRVL